MSEQILFPIQTSHTKPGGKLEKSIYLRAYEVYCEVFGEQPALIDLEGSGCRGGFAISEIIAFLYAHSFPKAEWDRRVHEAFKGMVNL